MTLQYARLFQLRAGVSLIHEKGPLTKTELADELRDRRSIDATKDPSEGAEQIVSQLQAAHIIMTADEEYQLSTPDELHDSLENPVLLYAGTEIPGAGDERVQADRILTNLMYEYPMLLSLSKFVFRNAPIEEFEVKRELVDTSFLGDKLNSFTVEMGLNLLKDAEVIGESSNGYTRERWPIRLFAHVVEEEYHDLGGDEGSGINEPELFERLQTLYGIHRDTFDRLLTRLHNAGIVSEASYEELLLNTDTLEGAYIYE